MKARTHTVTVRMTPDELALAERNAAAHGAPLATYLRRLALVAHPGESREQRVARSLAVLGTLTTAEADAIRSNVREVRKAWARERR
ncbi:MAG: hypothetical protein IPQ24_20650 [Anaeromyxobacter sp.]|nr:hypothetical protein [Anaeromyxobacter sp.]